MTYQLHHYGTKQADTDHFSRLIEEGGGTVLTVGESDWNNYTQIVFTGPNELIAELRKIDNIDVIAHLANKDEEGTPPSSTPTSS